MGSKTQRPNVYNSKLPDPKGQQQDSLKFLAEVKAGLAKAILEEDFAAATVWVVNLHKFVVLYGLNFSKEDHVYLIKVVFGLLVTKNIQPDILDKFAKVLSVLLKKKYLLSRADLQLDWRPLFELLKHWEYSGFAIRGLLKAPPGFNAQIKATVKLCRDYFTDESTSEMLAQWSHMLCPLDRSMTDAICYFSLFLTTTKEIPAEKSWKLWLPLFSDFWRTWGNSPAWEVDLLKLYSRLAFHRASEVDWGPFMPDLYTRFMSSFNLPVTYGGSGVHIKQGIREAATCATGCDSASNTGCTRSITKWIVHTLGPDSEGQTHLSRLLVALQSYFQPVNSNDSSDLLHVFVASLCTTFVDRVHAERYNLKWETKVPPDRRLTDEDIKKFVLSVKPIAAMVLYNDYEEEARSVFQSLSLLAPEIVVPWLLECFASSQASLTEPHRFHACVQALSAASGPLVRNYPGKAIDILHSLLPGIDVNDIWKCTNIFVLMSDLLEMIPLTDMSQKSNKSEYFELASQTSSFENFVCEFLTRCFTLIENSVRVSIRSDGRTTDDEYLNDEEVAADSAINDTFGRMCVNLSPEIFDVVFKKLKSFISGKITEPTVAGGIIAGMCKSVVQCNPEKCLAFFIPHIAGALVDHMGARRENGKEDVDDEKVDEELQFNLQLLGEVLNVRNVSAYRSTGSHILPYVEQICEVLDVTLDLVQKDEYELSHSVLGGLLSWLCHIRIVESGPRLQPNLDMWAAKMAVADLDLSWYKPGPQEFSIVSSVLERYLNPAVDQLKAFARGELDLNSEELERIIHQINRIFVGVSELTEPAVTGSLESVVLSSNLGWLTEVKLEYPGGLRATLASLMCDVQDRMAAEMSDDTDSYSAILNVFDALLFCYGGEEDEVADHVEEHKREKCQREDKLVRGKRHLPGLHLDRITLQWETQVWLKNLLVLECLPEKTLHHIFALCVHNYSEVRAVAQELLLKVVGRLGRCCHNLVLPLILPCLKEGVPDEVLKGALYLINSENHMFFYSWETASKVWPSLVMAMHCDKQSVDDLLREIGVKTNRFFSGFVGYTIPLSAPQLPIWLSPLVRTEMGSKISCLSKTSMTGRLHYKALETELVDLVEGQALHWRHKEMAVGMLLSMVTYDNPPSPRSTALWLDLLLSDQESIRSMAYQALEGILKLSKVKTRKAPLSDLVPASSALKGRVRPGVREDNVHLQYKESHSPEEREVYWSKPFVTKSFLGYHGWPENSEVRLSYNPKDFEHSPDSVLGVIANFFLDETKTAHFVDLSSLEHDKGSHFSTDRGLLLSFLFENIGPRLVAVFQNHIERLVEGGEENKQRAAAELVYGLVRGSRFWDFASAEALWSWLIPVFRQVLNNVTTETKRDWDFCFSGISAKTDPNRLCHLYESLVTEENLVGQGAFKESSYLSFVSKCLSLNWRVQGLYCRAFNILRSHWAERASVVRHQIASTLATLTFMDIPWAGEDGGSLGEGFPNKRLFIQEVIPKLNLNSATKEVMDRKGSPTDTCGSSDDVSMEIDDESLEGKDSEAKTASRTLETVSLWICHQIQISSASLDPDLFNLLPHLCQFIGTETDQDVSQACLQALCYLSVCILPSHAMTRMLDVVEKIARSESCKTKMSLLEFLQVTVFTNFPSVAHSVEHRTRVTELVLALLQDEHITVRQKSAKVLGGLVHSGFITGDALSPLIASLRKRIRPRMTKIGRKFKKESVASHSRQSSETSSNVDNIVHHSGILGLCAIAEAFPYDVPPFLPDLLVELTTHLNDPQPTPVAIKKSFNEFKRTHQDNWQDHRTKFTENQLVVINDLLVSQNYYA